MIGETVIHIPWMIGAFFVFLGEILFTKKQPRLKLIKVM